MSVTTRRRPASFIIPVSLFGLAAAVAADARAETDLEEIVVTGSRIQQRLEDAPVAVVVLNREHIDRASQDSIGKVLQQLPANTGSPINTNVNNGGEGSVRVDLRGFGAARTLAIPSRRTESTPMLQFASVRIFCKWYFARISLESAQPVVAVRSWIRL